MRILQLAPGLFPYHHTGVEVYTYRLSQALISRGHSVTVAAPVPEPDQSLTGPQIEPLPRIPTRFQGGEPSERDAKIGWDALVNVVRRTNPDIIHVQHLIHMGSASLTRLECLGIPFVVGLSDY
jgi:glycosyltransferase involved in cell wall biosynthesis